MLGARRLRGKRARREEGRPLVDTYYGYTHYWLLAHPIEVELATLDLFLRADAEPRDALRALPERAQRGERRLATAEPAVDARGVRPAWLGVG